MKLLNLVFNEEINITTVKTVISVATVITLIILPINIFIEAYSRAVVDFIYLFLIYISYPFYKKTNNFDKWSDYFLGLTSSLMVFLFIDGGTNGSTIIYSLGFPIIALHFKGYKKGGLYTIIYFFVLLLIFGLEIIGFGFWGLTFTQQSPNLLIFVFFGMYLAISAYLYVINKYLAEKEATNINNNKKYEKLFNNLNQGVALISSDRKILEINHKLLEWFPNSKSDSNELCFQCLNYDYKDKPCIDCHLSNSFSEGKQLEFNKTKITANGEKHFKVTAIPLFDNSENIYAVMETYEDITENIKNLEQLKIAEKTYRNLFQNSQIGLFRSDYKTGLLLNANDIIAKQLGFNNSNELISKNFYLQNWYADINDRKRIFKLLESTGQFQNEEIQFYKNKDTLIWIRISGKLDKENGIIEGVVQDITKERQTKQALLESEAKFRLIANNTSDVIWTMDLEGKFTFVSPSVYKLRGYTPKEIMIQPIEEALTKESLLHYYNGIQKYRKAISEGRELKETIKELEQPCKDGSTVWTEATISALNNDEGKVIGILGVTRDITERRKNEHRIRESEAKLHAIFDNANIGISITDVSGKYTMCNKWFLNYLGYDFKEISNKTHIDITHQDYKAISKKMFMQVINGEIDKYRLEKKFLRKNNTEVWGDLSVTPIKNANNEIVNMVGMITDITQNKIAEDKINIYFNELDKTNQELIKSKEIIESNLTQKNSLIEELELTTSKLETALNDKEKFLSILAHDLRNPLSSFCGLTKILYEEFDDISDSEKIEFIKAMQTTSENVYALLTNILEWSRVQKGIIPFQPKNIEIHNMVYQVIKLFEIIAASKNIELSNLIKENKVIFADSNLIQTIFRNLVSNAIKFTEFGGEITIGQIESAHTHWIFYVKDTGIGLKEEHKNILFDVGKSISTQGTNLEKGIGIGLLLCKEFAEKHNGKIWVESEIGKGSTFYFSIQKT